ncbi:MAG: hypothetical protein JAY75_23005 [Candidatus Thiodiazotropha taylori]|nr:hypothetical protein [Candidatus Thiodiazotropha taylori]MCW4249546.1 hypothetical protein [Candidatus Thiodiazotropha endolucinida]MCG7882934.1 hypothetical protein [Candidatus Thiodiazotropha taylori]MCG7888554.1 hypothetical protein [Candidatus Thiodiazotropha taylori]MCG7892252.1 hypothetical protein [Candidatus Thiodiazotropha taylori]
MTTPPNFPESFLLLQQEGHLISSCLGTGLTDLRAAHVHNKGAFYSALFNLSVGIERLMKAIVIIEHMLTNNLAVPTKKQLKVYGHNIVDLYDCCSSIANAKDIDFPDRQDLNTVQRELLSLLSDFAQTTRYHNLDALNPSHVGKDPLAHWGEILLAILEQDVSKHQKERILGQATLVASAIDDITTTVMVGTDKNPLTTEDALALPGLHDQAAKYAVLHLIKLLVPLRDLTSDLCHLAYSLNMPIPPFPQMQEFIDWIWDDRQYVLRKKKWP